MTYSALVDFSQGVGSGLSRFWSQLRSLHGSECKDIEEVFQGGVAVISDSSWRHQRCRERPVTVLDVGDLFRLESISGVEAIVTGIDQKRSFRVLKLRQGKFRVLSPEKRFVRFFQTYAQLIDSEALDSGKAQEKEFSLLSLKKTCEDALHECFSKWYDLDLFEDPCEEHVQPHRLLFGLEWMMHADSHRNKRIGYILRKRQSLLDVLFKKLASLNPEVYPGFLDTLHECAPIRGKSDSEWFPQSREIFVTTLFTFVHDLTQSVGKGSDPATIINQNLREIRSLISSFEQFKPNLCSYFDSKSERSHGRCLGKKQWWKNQDMFVLSEVILMNVAGVLYLNDRGAALNYNDIAKWEEELKKNSHLRNQMKQAVFDSEFFKDMLNSAECGSLEIDPEIVFGRIKHIFHELDGCTMSKSRTCVS